MSIPAESTDLREPSAWIGAFDCGFVLLGCLMAVSERYEGDPRVAGLYALGTMILFKLCRLRDR